jgi:hypothetical protein
MKTIRNYDMAEILGIPTKSFFPKAVEYLQRKPLEYAAVSYREQQACILEIMKILDENDGGIPESGPRRIGQWEDGWKENLDEFIQTESIESLIPKYNFTKNSKYLRFKGEFIKPSKPSFEYDFYTVVRLFLFQKYFKDVSSIIEFGCGTGTSLLILSDLFPDKLLTGCDWAGSSISIIEQLSLKKNEKIGAIKFDMFHPNPIDISEGCGIVTMHAMEQLGVNFEPFLNFMISKNPSICLHLEPISEFYDMDNALDSLAKKYHEKRGYLSGFLTSLLELEKQHCVSIIEARRLFFGSFFHEGYSLIVWKPERN